ncbi:MAG: hypothetical protein PHQ11_02225 [Paludibacter sp.]|nr:hypothetical protein [Paludibacter sp.]MDD4427948.1 hypothetical protein [Paludibacter sp.]
MAKELDKPTRILKINPSLIRILASAGRLLNLPFNKERLNKLTENYVVSNKKLKQAIGIQKMPVNALEGMEKTIKSFIK